MWLEKFTFNQLLVKRYEFRIPLAPLEVVGEFLLTLQCNGRKI